MDFPTRATHTGSKLLASLSPDEAQRLSPYMEEIEMTHRMVLCSVGQPITHVYFPYDAVTSTLMEMPEGDAVEVGLMGAEGMVGLDLLYGFRESVTTVMVQVPGRGMRMDGAAFAREVVAKRSPFYDLVLRYARVFFGMVAQSGACNASHGLQLRFARWLLLIHDRVRRDRFPLTHEYAALMLGVRRATVTDAANGLRVAGAIEYRRGEVIVTDRQALERSSCACYPVLRQLEESIFDSASRASQAR